MPISTSAVEGTISSPYACSSAVEGLCQRPGADKGLDEALAGCHLSWVLQPRSMRSATLIKRSVMLQLLLSSSVFRVVGQIIKDTLCVVFGFKQKATDLLACMGSEFPKCEQSMDIAFGFRSAYFIDMSPVCGVFSLVLLNNEPKAISTSFRK